ncbi:Uncharacterized protein Fot_14839 [Forsythia ovata]|uniref:Uncharacterized protein n=1 Tax=Forsythia ovata TaxID=205694 RepID=A0ABD1W7G4_9LAMI
MADNSALVGITYATWALCLPRVLFRQIGRQEDRLSIIEAITSKDMSETEESWFTSERSSRPKNLDMGPSPMISEAPKTPRMVSPTSNLTGINTLENVQQISIRDPVGPTKLHAPDPQLGTVIPTTRPKFQPDRTPDAPMGPNFQTEQSLGKQAISPSVDLQIENAPHAQNQHEIPYLPTQQTVGPDSRHVGPTIDFSHSIHMDPSLEAPLPAGPSHLSTAPSYI